MAAAQNLVPNPGFELFTSCPVGFSQFNGFVATWADPNMATPDYYNACAGSFPAGVPKNGTGYQPAHGGSAYAGLYATAGSYREFVQVQLSSTLVAGRRYEVRFYVALHNKSADATDDLGAYLSNTAPSSTGTGFLGGGPLPQVANPAGNVITDTLGWTLISGSYLATGGEHFLTIGHFLPDDQCTYTHVAFGGQGCYYYVDDVSVVDVTALPIELLGIHAQGMDGYNHLDWSTATERDNAGFDVQRSTDAQDFTSIGWVPGAILSVNVRAYGYDDHDALPDVLYYYRLQQVDLDGHMSCSPTVVACWRAGPALQLIPLGHARVQVITSADGPVDLVLFDPQGRVIHHQQALPKGADGVDLSPWLSGASAGVYVLRCTAGDGQAVLRLLH